MATSGIAAAGVAGTATAAGRVHARVETEGGVETLPVAELVERWDDPAAEFERRGIDPTTADLTGQCELECCMACTNCLCCTCG